MATLDSVNVAMSADHGKLQRDLQKAGKHLTDFGSQGQGTLGKLVSGFGAIGLAINGVQAVVGGISSLVSGPLQLAASAEQTAVAFKVLLGSGKEAEKMLKDIRDFAAQTPFEFNELADASKKLVAFGVEAENVVPNLRRLGDLSAGLNIPLGELSEIYGKLKVQNQVMGSDILQIAGRGIPIVTELAKVFGVTAEEIKGMVSAGKVNFSHVQQAIENMTDSGGKFFGLMKAQSGTLGGLWSTLSDTFTVAVTDIGNTIVEAFDLKGVLSNSTGFLEAMGGRWKEFLSGVKATIQFFKPIVIETVNVLIARWKAMADVVSYVVNYWKEVFSGVGIPSFTQFRDWILTGLITLEYGWLNWTKVLELAVKSGLVSVVAFGAEIYHTFTERIPAVLVWFSDNWRDILHDVAEFTGVLFMNLGSNIVKIITNIPDLIKGKTTFAELWTPLLEGAQFALKELPEIPDRVMGDFEKNLRSDIDGLAKDLVTGFDQFKDERLKELLPTTKLVEGLDEVKDKIETMPPIEFDASVGATLDKDSKDKIEHLGKQSELGSKEARDTIIRHQFNLKESSVTSQQLHQQIEANKHLKKIAEKPPTDVKVISLAGL